MFDPNQADFNGPVSTDRDDLLGGYPAPRRYIGWQTFFDLGDGQVKNNKKIDPTISSVLFTLPLPAIAPHTQTAPVVLPQRNLLRQLTWGLPSGQAIAARDGRRAAAAEPTWPTSRASTRRSAPARRCGTTSSPRPRPPPTANLGPVGGRIVAETLIGLLRADPTSYLSAYPEFHPFLGTDLTLGPTPNPNITGNRTYTRAHFLYYAGVVTQDTYR